MENRFYVAISIAEVSMVDINLGNGKIVNLRRGQQVYVTDEEAKFVAGQHGIGLYKESDEQFVRFIKTDAFYPFAFNKITVEEADKYLPNSVIDQLIDMRLERAGKTIINRETIERNRGYDEEPVKATVVSKDSLKNSGK